MADSTPLEAIRLHARAMLAEQPLSGRAAVLLGLVANAMTERDRLVRANADLAAAQTDLVEALREVRHQFFDEVEVGWKKRMRDRVDEAIARATGGKP